VRYKVREIAIAFVGIIGLYKCTINAIIMYQYTEEITMGYENAMPSPAGYISRYPQYPQRTAPINDPLDHAFGIWATGGPSVNQELDFDTWLAKRGGAGAFSSSIEPAIQRDNRVQLLADILGESNLRGIV
jgi:hypothetical protein